MRAHARVRSALAARALVACLLAACSGGPPSSSSAGSSAAESTSAAGAGGSAPATGSGGDGVGGDGVGGAGGAGGEAAPDAELTIAIVSPLEGMAFERRSISVEVTYATSVSGSTLALTQGGSVVDELSIGPAQAGAARLRLPLSRGDVPFSVTLSAPGGQSVLAASHVYGGQPVAAAQSEMLAARDGSIVRWGGGDEAPSIKAAPAAVTSVDAGNGGVFALDAAGHVYKASDSQGSFAILDGLEDILAIAPGSGHALFLRADGKVLCAGSNDHGQLGAGDTAIHPGVVEVPSLADIVAVAASNDASFAASAKGELFAWGENDEGQLGLGAEDASPHPKPLTVPGLANVEDVAAGRDHVLAVTADGELYAWGLGTSGQIGDGSSGILASKPQPVPIPLPDKAIAVTARGNTSYAILATGELLGWGQNSLAQLGVGDTSPRTKPSPCLVGAVRAASAGVVSGLAQSAAGLLNAWGSNASGQLGLPPPPDGPERSSKPVEVPWP